jgi:hypothetical protein
MLRSAFAVTEDIFTGLDAAQKRIELELVWRARRPRSCRRNNEIGVGPAFVPNLTFSET